MRRAAGAARRWRGLLVGAAVTAATLASSAPSHAARVELQLHQPDGRPLAGAVLYALPVPPRRLPPPLPAVMDQRDRRFVPTILPVQTGAEVSFANGDSISHHVYSFSPAKRFALFLNRGESHTPLRFDHPGVVAIGCNIHDWMLAYVLVVDTPWFAQTGADGVAVIAELPPGRYRLVAWHPRIREGEPALEREAEVGAAGERWELRLQAPLLPARDQEPGFSEYGENRTPSPEKTPLHRPPSLGGAGLP